MCVCVCACAHAHTHVKAGTCERGTGAAGSGVAVEPPGLGAKLHPQQEQSALSVVELSSLPLVFLISECNRLESSQNLGLLDKREGLSTVPSRM